MFFKDLLNVFLVMILVFQPYVQVFAEERIYNEKPSQWLAYETDKEIAIMLVKDFNADPNVLLMKMVKLF